MGGARIDDATIRKRNDRGGSTRIPDAIAEAFSDAGISSAVVHGGTPREERRLILKRLHEGDVQVVWNCGVLTEGFDEPTVSCVVMARPTKSAPLYQQIVGRGLRPDLSLPALERGDCLVLDVVGASGRHDLRTLVDLSERADAPPEMDEELSLMEMEDALQECQDAEAEARGWDPEEYYGETAVQEFDPLNRAGVGAWLRTDGGTYFLPASRGRGEPGAYILLVEGEEPNTYDVAWLAQDPRNPVPEGQGDLTEHRGLSLEMAVSWGEEVLEELGGSTALLLAGTKKRWRKDPPTAAQKAWAVRRGIAWEGLNKGELSDLRSTVEATNRIDPVVDFMKASR